MKLKLFCVALLSATMLFALPKDEIKPQVEIKTTQAIEVLTNASLSNEQKMDELFKIFDPLFDYKQMAKISLGKRFNTLNDSQKAEFSKAFEQKLKSSYADKLLGYTNQEIKVKELTEPQKNRVFLHSELLSEGKSYDFIYKFYNDNDNWLIYDMEIIGVSLLQTYRSQFADMLDNADFETLIKKLNETSAIKVDN
ncbi:MULTISPECIES: ABC transporter substrate-binding protein [unclassified Campylobacter]|uniref:Tgt2/MlaC family protein n=1 Tax=unclassified Campylobacter TaxID=2593542 RepID=UPI003D346649